MAKGLKEIFKAILREVGLRTVNQIPPIVGDWTELREELISLLHSIALTGQRDIQWGAPAKAHTFIPIIRRARAVLVPRPSRWQRARRAKGCPSRAGRHRRPIKLPPGFTGDRSPRLQLTPIDQTHQLEGGRVHLRGSKQAVISLLSEEEEEERVVPAPVVVSLLSEEEEEEEGSVVLVSPPPRRGPPPPPPPPPPAASALLACH